MSFIFTPLSKDELAKAANLLEAGDAHFEIIDAHHATSKTTGAPMIKVTLEVTDKNHCIGMLYEYFVTNNDYAHVKLHGFLSALGLEDWYDSGNLDLNKLVAGNYSGHCVLGMQKDKRDGTDRIAIKRYHKKANGINTAPIPAASAMAPADFNDDIPF